MGRPAKYPAEFRREAVALVKSSGRPVAEVARSLEIAEGTLWNCVKLDRDEPPRDSWRLQPLRGWSHVNVQQVRAGGA
jgi:transposase